MRLQSAERWETLPGWARRFVLPACLLLAAAGVLMLLAGALFALIRQWVYAALIWAGALGCLAAALNFRGKAKDAHQHEDEQV